MMEEELQKDPSTIVFYILDGLVNKQQLNPQNMNTCLQLLINSEKECKSMKRHVMMVLVNVFLILFMEKHQNYMTSILEILLRQKEGQKQLVKLVVQLLVSDNKVDVWFRLLDYHLLQYIGEYSNQVKAMSVKYGRVQLVRQIDNLYGMKEEKVDCVDRSF